MLFGFLCFGVSDGLPTTSSQHCTHQNPACPDTVTPGGQTDWLMLKKCADKGTKKKTTSSEWWPA